MFLKNVCFIGIPKIFLYKLTNLQKEWKMQVSSWESIDFQNQTIEQGKKVLGVF